MSLLGMLAYPYRGDYAELRRRPPLMHPDFPFLLLWSHKAASSVLAHWFFEQIGSPHLAVEGASKQDYHGLGIHRYQFRVHNRQPGYLGDCVRALRAGKPAIRFVRDPAARAYSGFLSARRRAAVRRADFWGYGVRAAVLRTLKPGTEKPETPFSFADFIEWVACTDPAELNNHVRQQTRRFEYAHRIEYRAIEDLQRELEALEERFGLAPIAGRSGVLDSPHHREKSASLTGHELEEALRAPVAIGELEDRLPPAVDTARLAGTALGARIREVFAEDYTSCGLY